jgi:hypothetical protein
MLATGEWAAAAALSLFGALMGLIPETFRTLWDRNIISFRSSISELENQNIVGSKAGIKSPAEAAFQQFIANFERLLNGRGQIITALILGVLGGAWVPVGDAIDDIHQGVNAIGVLRHQVKFLRTGLTKYLLSQDFLLYFIVGLVLGLLIWRMLATSYEIWRLGIDFDLDPQFAHPDRCGGFAPLGYLCLWSALIASVAATYLGGWIIVLRSKLGGADPLLAYGSFYARLFYAYMAVPIAYAILSFFVPVWNVHRIMVKKREVVLEKLDQLGHGIDLLSRTMLEQAESVSPAQNEIAAKKLDLMRQTYENNKDIPVWPFNTHIIVRFVSSLIIPLLGLTHLGQPVVNTITEFVKFLSRSQ